MDERQERDIAFVIAYKYPEKSLELLKEAFNQMALFVSVPVHRLRIVDVDLRWNRIGSVL